MANQMAYAWKPNSRLSIPAGIAGAEIERIRQERAGFFTPASLVEASRPADAPLHPAFEWNDRKAASAYREVQASHMIRSIVVLNSGDPEGEPLRAFVSVKREDDGHCYTSMVYAMKHPDMREYVLSEALREMHQFERKYANLVEFASVIREIRRTRTKVEKRGEARTA